jgi:ribosomal protein S2|mmetsp:Transcript_22171/g.72685  ORF Transcript_22171/g.72685 Transcript_22171/m.72685 type:complete len:294 (-) Transcript_22171:93-974(-)
MFRHLRVGHRLGAGLSRAARRGASSGAELQSRPPRPPAAGSSSSYPQPPGFRRDSDGGRTLTTRDLMATRAFLGYEQRVTHPANYRYLLGFLSGHAIIDPEKTLLSLRRVLSLLKKISFSGGKVLVVSTQPKLARLTRVIGEQSGHFYLARKWTPGLLSNWELSRRQVRKAIELSPIAQRTGRVRQSDVQRALNFKGIEHMARPPDAIVLLDSTSLHGEPAAANIPVIGVVDTDGPARDVDYPIPANANSVRFYHTLANLLVRALKEGEALRATLGEYTSPAEGDLPAAAGHR